MNVDKLPGNPISTPDVVEVDTRRAKRLRRTVGGLSLVAATAGAGFAYNAATSSNEAPSPAAHYTTVEGDTTYGIAKTVCNPSPADLPKVIFNLEEANPDVANGNGQLGVGQKLELPQDMCDTSVK